MVHKRGLLVLKPQECEGNYDFTKAKHYMTRRFLNYFQELAPGITTVPPVIVYSLSSSNRLSVVA